MARRRAVVVSHAAGVVGDAVAAPALERPLRRRRRGRPRRDPSHRWCGSGRRRCAAARRRWRRPPRGERHRRPVRSTRGAVAPVGGERTQLEAPEARHRVLGGDGDRLVDVGALEDVEAGDPLAVSANGPSVTSTSPLRMRTVRASAVGRSASPITRVPDASWRSTQSSTSSSLGSPVGGSGAVSVQTNIMYFTAGSSGRFAGIGPTTNGTRPIRHPATRSSLARRVRVRSRCSSTAPRARRTACRPAPGHGCRERRSARRRRVRSTSCRRGRPRPGR